MLYTTREVGSTEYILGGSAVLGTGYKYQLSSITLLRT
jgi:hypothetical protein